MKTITISPLSAAALATLREEAKREVSARFVRRWPSVAEYDRLIALGLRPSFAAWNVDPGAR